MHVCDLPSGSKVSVEEPNFSHRMEAVKEFRSLKDEVGYSVEELMAAKSVVAFNGHSIDQTFISDPIYLLSDWPNPDVQYYIEWYMTLFFLDDRVRDKAVNAAKKLMTGGGTATSGKSKTSPAKV